MFRLRYFPQDLALNVVPRIETGDLLAAHIAKPCQHGAWQVGLVSENEQRLIVGSVVLQALQDDGGQLGLVLVGNAEDEERGMLALDAVVDRVVARVLQFLEVVPLVFVAFFRRTLTGHLAEVRICP